MSSVALSVQRPGASLQLSGAALGGFFDSLPRLPPPAGDGGGDTDSSGTAIHTPASAAAKLQQQQK
jgi:hypothetical protein